MTECCCMVIENELGLRWNDKMEIGWSDRNLPRCTVQSISQVEVNLVNLLASSSVSGRKFQANYLVVSLPVWPASRNLINYHR